MEVEVAHPELALKSENWADKNEGKAGGCVNENVYSAAMLCFVSSVHIPRTPFEMVLMGVLPISDVQALSE